jgi:hypothetical protein
METQMIQQQASADGEGTGKRFNSGVVSAYLALNVVLAIAALLPWETLGTVEASGIELGRGWVVLGAAVIGGLLSLDSLSVKSSVGALRFTQVAVGCAAVAMVVAEIVVLSSAGEAPSSTGGYNINDYLFQPDPSVQPEIGAGAVIAGGAGAILAALALFKGPAED